MKAYFRCKSIDQLIKDAKSSNDLKRSIGAVQLILLGIGAIIGAGIFVLAGTASQSTGPAIILSFALSGLACACAGLCYAELSSMLPISGSAYTYMYVTLGEVIAWLVVSLMIIGSLLTICTVASGWSGYMMSLLHDFGFTLSPKLLHTTGSIVQLNDGSTTEAILDLPVLFIMFIIGLILYRGVQTSTMINSIIVYIKMIALIGFVIIGAFSIDPQNWVPFIPSNTGHFGEFGISGIVSGAAMVFLAYNGFDTIATAAQEAKNPQRDIPIGIIGAISISTITYILVSGVLTGIVNYKYLNVPQPIAIALDKINIPWFGLIVKIGAIAGLTSVILVMTYSVVRVMFIVTKDGLLPKFLGRLHSYYKTPHVATVVMCVIASIISATVALEELVKLANMCVMLVFSIVCFVCLYLRYKEPKLIRVFKCPFMPWIPIIGIILFGQILLGLQYKTYIQFLVVILIAFLFYIFYGKKHSVLNNVSTTTV